MFLNNGGDLNDVPGSIYDAHERLRDKSNSVAFLSVGSISSDDRDICTGTWIGNEEYSAGQWSYFLTAAHCFTEGDAVLVSEKAVTATFTAYDGSIAASGEGVFYITEMRVNLDGESDSQGHATDIGLLKLPKHNDIYDASAKPIRQPLLYDGDKELYYTVDFVGYGLWGLASVSMLN